MKKPAWQMIMEYTIPFFFFLTTLITAIDTIKRNLGFLNYKSGFALFAASYIGYLILLQGIKAGKIKRVVNGSQVVRITKLGVKSEFYCLGIITVLGCYSGFDFVKNGPLFKPKILVEAPAFRTNDPYFNILILPWKQECFYKGQRYDIGYVLKQRLEDLNLKDTLNIRVHYLDNLVMSRNFNSDSAYKLMRLHNANQVLFGNYSGRQCEGGNSDKICYKYLTNSKELNPADKHARNDYYKMIPFHDYDDIRTGEGLQNSDYVAYWVAALSAMNKQTFPRAIRMFEKIKNYQQEEAVLFQISNCYQQMKDYTSARTSLEKVLLINPDHQEANLHIALLLFNEGKIGQVKQKLEKFLSLNPTDKSVLADLCVVYKKLKDTARYNLSLARLQEVVPATHNRIWGEFYQKVHEYQGAKDHYEKALKSCSKHARDWSVLGEVNLHLKDTAKAKAYFKKALAIDPNYVTALNNLGGLLYKEGDYKMAETYLERAIRISPYHEDALAVLGNVYSKLNKNEQALVCFEKALAIKPDHVSALIGASVQLMQAKKHSKANAYLDKVINLFPASVALLDKIAYLCADKKNYSQATIYYKQLLQLSPGNGAVLYNLAGMSAYQEEPENALNYLSQALEVLPALKVTAAKDKAFEKLRGRERFIAMTQAI